MPEASVVHSWIYRYNTVLYVIIFIMIEYKYIFDFIQFITIPMAQTLC